MFTLLKKFWRWLVDDPFPNDPDKNTTGWN